MQSMIRIALMLSMLFMSIEGAVDIVSTGHPHGDGSTHAVDIQSPSADDPGASGDLSGGHSEDCCHGHLASIIVASSTPATYFARVDPHGNDVPRVLNYVQAPPTPPPNA